MSQQRVLQQCFFCHAIFPVRSHVRCRGLWSIEKQQEWSFVAEYHVLKIAAVS
jgi:hypothetical protein